MFNILKFIPISTGTYVSSEIPSNFLRETYSNYQPLHLSSHLTYPPHQNMNYFQKFISNTHITCRCKSSWCLHEEHLAPSALPRVKTYNKFLFLFFHFFPVIPGGITAKKGEKKRVTISKSEIPAPMVILCWLKAHLLQTTKFAL